MSNFFDGASKLFAEPFKVFLRNIILIIGKEVKPKICIGMLSSELFHHVDDHAVEVISPCMGDKHCRWCCEWDLCGVVILMHIFMKVRRT